jgi:hypothetical protein
VKTEYESTIATKNILKHHLISGFKYPDRD